MKHLKVYLLLLLAIAAHSCSEDPIEKEKVQFTFDLKATSSDNGRTKSISDIPSGSSLLISIQTGSGSSVYTMHSMQILNLGGSMVTTPLELAPGSYKLTDFMIVNDDDEVLFATPRRDSPLARYVVNPLDVPFNVGANAVKNIPMEVMDVSTSTPEDFGYVSFNVNVVHPLSIAVFAAVANGVQTTSAKAQIIKNGSVLQEFNLAARVNQVPFKLEVDETYTLRIMKSGSVTHEQTFVYNDLIASLQGLPLKITLQPAFTMITNFQSNYYFSMSGEQSEGLNVTVNWGDGTSDSAPAYSDYYMHDYAEPGNYEIQITGDLKSIRRFDAFYGDGSLNAIDVQHLTELRTFILGLTESPEIIDLTKLTKLERCDIPSAQRTTTLLLPTSPNLRYINVDGSNLMTTATISAVIDKVYANTVNYNIQEGTISMSYLWYEDPEHENEFVAQPTPEAMAKLAELRSLYGWSVIPNF